MSIATQSWRRRTFPVLLAVFAVAYVWRISGVLPVDPVTNHLSNFYLTGAALTLLSGPTAFVDPSRRPRALLLAGLFAGINLVAEVLLAIADMDDEVNRAMGDVNTTDPVDGLFGLVAVVLVVTLLPRASPRPTGP